MGFSTDIIEWVDLLKSKPDSTLPMWSPGAIAYEMGWDRLHVALAILLGRGSSPQKALLALNSLKVAGAIDPLTLYEISAPNLAALISDAGLAKQKAVRIKGFVNLLHKLADAEEVFLDSALGYLAAYDTTFLRDAFCSVSGISLESASIILLYALDRKVLPARSQFFKVLLRHSYVYEDSGMEEYLELFEDVLFDEVEDYKIADSLLIFSASNYCKTKERCAECPLSIYLE